MSKSNYTLTSLDILKITLPQLIMFFLMMIFFYISSKSHAYYTVFFSFYFLIFYGFITLPLFLLLFLNYATQVIGIENETFSIIINIAFSVYGALIPIIFGTLSVLLSKYINNGSIDKRRLKIIFKIHFIAGFFLFFALNFKTFELSNFLEINNIISQCFAIIFNILLLFVLWKTFFEIADRKTKKYD